MSLLTALSIMADTIWPIRYFEVLLGYYLIKGRYRFQIITPLFASHWQLVRRYWYVQNISNCRQMLRLDQMRTGRLLSKEITPLLSVGTSWSRI
jgi:hypothetical protein